MGEFAVSLGHYKEMIALVVALVGGGFALWRWTIEQRWKRVQYTYQLVKEFMAKDNTKKALSMLDTTNEIELFPHADQPDDRFVYVNETQIIRALRIKDEGGFTEEDFAIRMIFDEFFTDLSMFQHHIDAKLIRLEDVRPYLEYWIKSICGYGVVKTAELASQINHFLVFFDFAAVLRISESMGWKFKANLG